MTTADTMPVPLEQASAGAAAGTDLLERLAERLGGKASVTAVYGEPVTCHGVTVIPVARIAYGFGGGAGEEHRDTKTGEGGGGGGGVDARPLGYIEIVHGSATFKPIRDPWADIIVPLTAFLASAAGPRIARTLTKRHRRGSFRRC